MFIISRSAEYRILVAFLKWQASISVTKVEAPSYLQDLTDQEDQRNHQNLTDQ